LEASASLPLLIPVLETATGICWLATLDILAGVLSLALIALFTSGMMVTIRRGRVIPCGCSGALGDSPVGWNTVSRNCVLGAVAGAVVLFNSIAPGPHASLYSEFTLGIRDGPYAVLIVLTGAATAISCLSLLDASLSVVCRIGTMRRYRAAGVAIVHKARADKSTRSQSSSTARCQAEGLSAVLDKLPLYQTLVLMP